MNIHMKVLSTPENNMSSACSQGCTAIQFLDNTTYLRRTGWREGVLLVTTGYTNSCGQHHFIFWIDVLQGGHFSFRAEGGLGVVDSVYFMICCDNGVEYILEGRVSLGIAGVNSYFAAEM